MYGSIGTIQLKLGKKKPETDPNICNCNKIEESFQFFHPNVPLGNTCHNNSAMQPRSSLRDLAMYFAYCPLSCINYQTKITTKNKWSIYVNKQTAQSDQTHILLWPKQCSSTRTSPWRCRINRWSFEYLEAFNLQTIVIARLIYPLRYITINRDYINAYFFLVDSGNNNTTNHQFPSTGRRGRIARLLGVPRRADRLPCRLVTQSVY